MDMGPYSWPCAWGIISGSAQWSLGPNLRYKVSTLFNVPQTLIDVLSISIHYMTKSLGKM